MYICIWYIVERTLDITIVTGTSVNVIELTLNTFFLDNKCTCGMTQMVECSGMCKPSYIQVHTDGLYFGKQWQSAHRRELCTEISRKINF